MPKYMMTIQDQENHEFINLPIYDGKFEEALSALSGEGAERQLINALTPLGIHIYAQLEADTDSEE